MDLWQGVGLIASSPLRRSRRASRCTWSAVRCRARPCGDASHLGAFLDLVIAHRRTGTSTLVVPAAAVLASLRGGRPLDDSGLAVRPLVDDREDLVVRREGPAEDDSTAELTVDTYGHRRERTPTGRRWTESTGLSHPAGAPGGMKVDSRCSPETRVAAETAETWWCPRQDSNLRHPLQESDGDCLLSWIPCAATNKVGGCAGRFWPFRALWVPIGYLGGFFASTQWVDVDGRGCASARVRTQNLCSLSRPGTSMAHRPGRRQRQWRPEPAPFPLGRHRGMGQVEVDGSARSPCRACDTFAALSRDRTRAPRCPA